MKLETQAVTENTILHVFVVDDEQTRVCSLFPS